MGEILIVNKQNEKNFAVDLYVRSWIEMKTIWLHKQNLPVDLYVRSWIEIFGENYWLRSYEVDLYVRSWIEISLLCAEIADTRLSTSMWGRELKWSMHRKIN